MSSKVYTETTISDLRQAAEAEVVSGPQSQLAMPGGVSLGPGASLTMTGLPAQQTFESMLSNTDSTLGKVLGLTSQLAAGIFETSRVPQPATASIQQAGVGGTYNYTMLLFIGIAALFLFGLRK